MFKLTRTPDGCTWTCHGCGVTSPVLRDDRAGDRWQRLHTSVHQGQRAVRGAQKAAVSDAHTESAPADIPTVTTRERAIER